MLHLTRHTHTYVPLAPYLLPILTSTLSPSSKPKASTLRPLDFDLHIRAPQQYLKTRVYNEGLAEEAAFLLAEYLASPPVHGSIGFPEVTVPIVLLLRKAIKGAKHAPGKGAKAKEAGLAKALVERVEESAKWAEQKRRGVSFAPGRLGEVERWEADVGDKADDTPLGRYVKVQRKAREKRRKLVEKVRVHGPRPLARVRTRGPLPARAFALPALLLATSARALGSLPTAGTSRVEDAVLGAVRRATSFKVLIADCSCHRHGRAKTRYWRTELRRPRRLGLRPRLCEASIRAVPARISRRAFGGSLRSGREVTLHVTVGGCRAAVQDSDPAAAVWGGRREGVSVKLSGGTHSLYGVAH